MRLVGTTELPPEQVVLRLAQHLRRKRPFFGSGDLDGTWWGTIDRSPDLERDIIRFWRAPFGSGRSDTAGEIIVTGSARGSRLELNIAQGSSGAVPVGVFLGTNVVICLLLRAVSFAAIGVGLLLGVSAALASSGIDRASRNRVLNFVEPLVLAKFEELPPND
ncbi:MAG: hypothetical protein JST54_10595 [Deltaproteobacteria bacterium]|nr:hypothetical protein [Deltaproteobacteria bacterium]